MSTQIITKEGHEALKQELDYLRPVKRPDTAKGNFGGVDWANPDGRFNPGTTEQY
ncbi:hypothetical protein [Pseudomonas sp. CCC4.3]|uniref:hypothetical protein n=1 Tax=unclassified Pseudomonas TaxID=196821 RepID=UPI0034DDBFA3